MYVTVYVCMYAYMYVCNISIRHRISAHLETFLNKVFNVLLKMCAWVPWWGDAFSLRRIRPSHKLIVAQCDHLDIMNHPRTRKLQQLACAWACAWAPCAEALCGKCPCDVCTLTPGDGRVTERYAVWDHLWNPHETWYRGLASPVYGGSGSFDYKYCAFFPRAFQHCERTGNLTAESSARRWSRSSARKFEKFLRFVLHTRTTALLLGKCYKNLHYMCNRPPWKLKRLKN